MNTKNNKRRQRSQEKIERVFIELLQKKELNKITVSEICKLSGLNRSTFYANYIDTYDLADRIKKNLEDELKLVYEEEWENRTHSYNFLKLFQHISNNQLFYNTYFKIDYENTYQSMFYNPESLKDWFNDEYLEYHLEFFKSGITAIIKKWLKDGCKQTPEEMAKILETEYQGRIMPILDI